MTRTVEGKTGTARFDTVAGSDRIPVLRMHFHVDGEEYEATYHWQSDPDNYPRFTGYLYLSGTNRLVSKRFSRSTNDRKDVPKVAFNLTQVFDVEWR